MTDNIEVFVDRQKSIGWPFPAYEAITDMVKHVDSVSGRSSERDKYEVGTCDIQLEVDRQNVDFAVDFEADEPYINGFTRACMDYLGPKENTVTIFKNAGSWFEGPNSIGSVQIYVPRLTQFNEWRLGPDIEYYAEVEASKSYVVSFALQDMTTPTPADDYPLQAKVYWFTESGGFIKSDIFQNNTYIAVNVETRVYGVVQAPQGAAYASLGSDCFTSATSDDLHLRFSKFMIHEYDAAYEAANGTPLKPFALGDLYGRPAQKATPVAVTIPGNQYKIADYTKALIGATPDARDITAIDIAPPVYKMETLTAANVTSYLYQTRVTRSLITTDAKFGTQCVRAQTDTTGTGSWALYLAPNTSNYYVPVTPGKTYRFSIYVKNKAASAATFSLLVRGTNGVQSNVLTNQSIGASSAWIQYSGTWTAPTDVYAAMMIMTFNAASYDLYIDHFEVKQTFGSEPAQDYNYLARFGDFESVTSSWLQANTFRSAGVNARLLNDNTAGAPSGTKFLSIDKPSGTGTTEYIVLNKSLETTTAYAEAARSYVFRVMAKNATAKPANIWLGIRFNDTVFNTGFDYSYKVALTGNWTECKREFTVPTTASGVAFTIVVEGAAADAVTAYVDDVSMTRVAVGMRSDLSSINETSLMRTTVYQVDNIVNNKLVYMMWGNDLLQDASAIYNWQHSGKRRIRFKATLQYAGYDLPTGSSISLVAIGTNGRGLVTDEGLASRAYRALTAWNTSQAVTIPTAANPTVQLDMLAPDIPWRAWTFALVFTLPVGSTKIGYTFSNEYIGPDGYQDLPGKYESPRFFGTVDIRTDDTKTIAVGNKRVVNVHLSSIDKMGALAAISLRTPYQDVVLRDQPIAYLPLNDTNIAEIGGRLQKPPTIWTVGTPTDTWGAKPDSEVNLAGLKENEGGSWKFTAGPNVFSGQAILIDDPTMQASPGRGMTIGAWFSHTGAIASDAYETIVCQPHTKVDTIDGGDGIYISLTRDGIDAGIFVGMSIDVFPNLATDGLPHYVVVASDGDRYTIYVDGVLVGVKDVLYHLFDQTFIGGEYRHGQFSNMFNGHIGQVEVYDYQLSSSEVWQHWKSGKGLRKGETELERIEHVLNIAQQSGVPPIVRDRDGNIPETVTTLTTPSWKNSNALGLLNDIASWTGGQIFTSAKGQIIYENRRQRFNFGGESNQQWKIGVGSNIIPELDQGLGSSIDPNKLINDATITAKYVDVDKGGVQRVVNRKSVSEYGRHTYDQTYDLDKPEDAKYAAQWLVNTNGKPYPRAVSLKFDYNANSETADFCKNVRKSDYVYGDLSIDNGIGKVSGFVENIQHTIDADGLTRWTTTIQISPGENQQVWVIGDATYGKLDAGYRLAY